MRLLAAVAAGLDGGSSPGGGAGEARFAMALVSTAVVALAAAEGTTGTTVISEPADRGVISGDGFTIAPAGLGEGTWSFNSGALNRADLGGGRSGESG